MANDNRQATPTGVGAKPWIKMRTDLWNDPRTSALCDALDTDEARVIGGLYRLWSIADSHSTDGRLPWWAESMVDRKCGIVGFGQALQSVGWIVVDDDNVTIPDFEIHNGQSAKSRAQNSLRQQVRRSRKAADAEGSRTTRDNNATDSRRRSVTAMTREEESRDLEKTTKEPPPQHSTGPATTLAGSSDSWQEVVALLGNVGLAAAKQTARDARQKGYSTAQITELCAELAKRPQLGPGALAWRIQNVAPNRPLTDGWPETKSTTKQAPEIDVGRYTATWSKLRPSRRAELARMAQVDLSGFEGQGLRELPGKLRAPILETLAREAGDNPLSYE
jgi:hypothetical protein